MAYKHTNSKGVTYYLNSKAVVLRGGKEQTIYYFSKDQRPEASDLPSGMEVNENPRNGFLTVKRGELQAIHVRNGRRKGLRILVPQPETALFDTTPMNALAV